MLGWSQYAESGREDEGTGPQVAEAGPHGEVVEAGELMLAGVGSLTPGYWKLDVQGSGEQLGLQCSDSRAGEAPGGAAVDDWRTGDLFEHMADGWYRHACR